MSGHGARNSDSFMTGWSEGYDEGRAQGRNDAEVILTDLIANLQTDLRIAEDPIAAECIARAEARLREVTGDE